MDTIPLIERECYLFSMKNLPSSSKTDMVNGIWFVHREPGAIIRVWLSTLNGKEKVYVNEDLVVERRNITRLTTMHSFEYHGKKYDLEIFASNLMLMELQCNIFCDGELISAQLYGYLPNGSYEIRDNDKPEVVVNRALDRYRSSGIKELNEYDLEQAKSFFQKAQTIDADNPETYFLLACIASLNEEKDDALDLLEKALSNDLHGKSRVLSEEKLAWIRIQPEFEVLQKKHFPETED